MEKRCSCTRKPTQNRCPVPFKSYHIARHHQTRVVPPYPCSVTSAGIDYTSRRARCTTSTPHLQKLTLPLTVVTSLSVDSVALKPQPQRLLHDHFKLERPVQLRAVSRPLELSVLSLGDVSVSLAVSVGGARLEPCTSLTGCVFSANLVSTRSCTPLSTRYSCSARTCRRTWLCLVSSGKFATQRTRAPPVQTNFDHHYLMTITHGLPKEGRHIQRCRLLAIDMFELPSLADRFP